MLSNVIESLNRIAYERIQILKPLTLVDGLSFQRYRAEYTELYLDQIRNASYLAITSGEICPTHYKDAEEAWWEKLLTGAADVSEPKSETESSMPQARCRKRKRNYRIRFRWRKPM